MKKKEICNSLWKNGCHHQNKNVEELLDDEEQMDYELEEKNKTSTAQIMHRKKLLKEKEISKSPRNSNSKLSQQL